MADDSGDFKIFDLLSILDTLKHLKRTGWVKNKIPEPETVAGHMYRMAVLAMGLEEEQKCPPGNGTPRLNVTHCVRMALVHDIGEAIVGDITPHCGVSNQNKFSLEESALQQIGSYVPKWIGAEWLALWHEYEENSTPEARLVKQLDKFDMLAQALRYEERFGIDLSEFFDSTPPELFITKPVVGWAAVVRARHQKWRSEHNEMPQSSQ